MRVTTGRPGFFSPAEAPLFGWLHAAQPVVSAGAAAGPLQARQGAGSTAGPRLDPLPAAAGLGVVLCPPLGQEASNSYRTQQALADALSARGLPTLRFDYAGTGDSADRPEDPAQGALPGWQASVDAAIDHLRAATGVARVAVLAMRAGALVAVPVAARRPDVAALVAVAPAIAGRSLLREWRALAATAALRDEAADGALEVAGAVFSAATVQALGATALADLVWPADRPVLLIDRDDLPAAERWRARLQADGVPLTAQAHGGIAAMLDEPQHQVVPQALVQAVAGFLADPRPAGSAGAAPAWPGAAGQGTPAEARQAPPAPGTAAGIRPPAVEPLDGPAAPRTAGAPALVAPGVRERVLTVDAAGTPLFGLLSEPAGPDAAPGGQTLVLPNTGPVHHIGGHRLYVLLARQLAAAGHRVLRLDLSGLGDSPARPGAPADEVYGRHAVDDLAAAVAALQARWPEAMPRVLGLCAGGYHALRLAVRQRGVAQCIVVNPLVYHWHEGMTLAGYEAELQARYYGSKWRRWASWRRLLTGQSDLRLLARVAAARLGQRLAALAGRAGRPGAGGGGSAAAPPPPDDLDHDLRTATAHGTRLQFVFSAGEPGWPALQAEAGRALAELQRRGRVQVHHLPRADHTLTTRSARERFIALVQALLQDDATPAMRPRAAPAQAGPPSPERPQPPRPPQPAPAPAGAATPPRAAEDGPPHDQELIR